MRKLLLIGLLALLVAGGAMAQTGDCSAETGTSTTWEWIRLRDTSGQLQFTFYAAGLLNKSSITISPNFPPGTDVAQLADDLCEGIDSSRAADEFLAGVGLVSNNPNAELVQPAFPEVCNDIPPAPNNPSLTVLEQCRLAKFHQYAIRHVWPEDARGLRDGFWGIWDWVDRSGPSGPGFNTGEKQDWLGLDGGQWSGRVNPRMNNMRAFVSAFDQDGQWRGELD